MFKLLQKRRWFMVRRIFLVSYTKLEEDFYYVL
jgi:hypothetical protein